jgi:hypothetical protein
MLAVHASEFLKGKPYNLVGLVRSTSNQKSGNARQTGQPTRWKATMSIV